MTSDQRDNWVMGILALLVAITLIHTLATSPSVLLGAANVRCGGSHGN